MEESLTPDDRATRSRRDTRDDVSLTPERGEDKMTKSELYQACKKLKDKETTK